MRLLLYCASRTTMKLKKYDIFKSALKTKLNDCLDFVAESHNRHNDNLLEIEDELSNDFYKQLISIDYSLDCGVISTYSIFDHFFQQLCLSIEKNSGTKLSDQKGKNDNDNRRKFIK